MTTRRNFLTILGAAAVARPGLSFAQSSEAFRLGILTPLTGAGSHYGPGVAKTLTAAAQLINEAGGAGGRLFEVFTEDDQTQPQAGVLAAKKLIEVNRVRAILGGWSTSVSMAVMPLTNDANVVFGYTSTSPDLSDPKYNSKWLGLRLQAPAPGYGRAFAEICEREGFKRVAIIANNNGSSVGIADAFEKTWVAKGNQPVARVIYEPNQTSYRAELEQILAAQPDCIIGASYLTDMTIILKDWYQSGATNKWIGVNWAVNSDLVKALGAEASEGLISVAMAPNVGSPAFKAFDDLYRKVMSAPGDTNNDASMNWDGLNVLALALESAKGAADGVELVKHIKAVSGPGGAVVSSFEEGRELLRKGQEINYEGAATSVDFGATNDIATNYAVYEVKGGALEAKYNIERS